MVTAAHVFANVFDGSEDAVAGVPHPRAAEAGYSLVALVASVTIGLILMSAAVPTWKYLMKNDREEELIFRGTQVAKAIERFQRKNGNALPLSLESLVQGKYLRKLYKDPMTREGDWRLVRQGEAIGVPPPGAPVTLPGGGASVPAPQRLEAGPRQNAAGAFPVGTRFGPIVGVASKSTEKSLRLFNGRSRYNEWVFAANQPRIVGRPRSIGPDPTPAQTPPGEPAQPERSQRSASPRVGQDPVPLCRA